MIHFVPLRPEHTVMWGKYKNMYKVCCELLTDSDQALCTENFIRTACRCFGPKVFNPNMYRCLLSALKLPAGATVLDLHPGTGLKAMACALLGLKYRYQTGPGAERLVTANRNGLAGFIGLDCAPWDGGRIDLVIADDELRQGVDLAAILGRYGQAARRLVCLVSPGERQQLQERYRPDKVIGIKPKLHARQHSYLFIW